MRGSWLVLALLVLSTTSARASAPGPCSTAPLVLPLHGSVDVPRNTKIWVVGGMFGTSRLDGGGARWMGDGELDPRDDARATQRFDIGDLAPEQSYRFRSLAHWTTTRFTTSAHDDTTPPARPTVRAVRVAVSEHRPGFPPVTEIGLDTAFDDDAALVHVVFRGERSQRSLITTVAHWRASGDPACGAALPFWPGERITVEISAIDLAGNESLPVVRDVEVERAVRRLCVHGGRNLGQTAADKLNPYVALASGTVVALVCLFGVLGYVAGHLRRMRDARFAMPEPISLLVAERLARAVQRRAGVIAAMGVAGVPALVVMDLGPFAIISTVVGCLGLRGFFVARGVLQLIERRPPIASPGAEGVPVPAPGLATAELSGTTVIVRTATDEVYLEASPKAIAAARRHAIPTSIANRT